MSVRKTPLGTIQVPESTIEHDFAIQERYQDFTAEVLRLSLLGISGIGYIALKYVFPEKTPAPLMPTDANRWFMVALAGFGLASIASLVHRYVSVDSLSWHLQSIRKEIRDQGGDSASADSDRRYRYARFRQSRYAVVCSALSLGVGACAMAMAFYMLIQNKPNPPTDPSLMSGAPATEQPVHHP
jgi:hypothetical protein